MYILYEILVVIFAAVLRMYVFRTDIMKYSLFMFNLLFLGILTSAILLSCTYKRSSQVNIK